MVREGTVALRNTLCAQVGEKLHWQCLTWPWSQVLLHFTCLQSRGFHLFLPQGCNTHRQKFNLMNLQLNLQFLYTNVPPSMHTTQSSSELNDEVESNVLWFTNPKVEWQQTIPDTLVKTVLKYVCLQMS